MTSKLTRLTDDELTETLRQATSGYPLPASVEGNLRHAFAELQERRKAAMDSEPVYQYVINHPHIDGYEKWEDCSEFFYKGIPGHLRRALYRHAQPAPECQHQWRHGGANKLQNQKQYIKCGRVELDAQPAPEREKVRREHAEWSQSTFGDVGPVGPLKHLSKEALEAAAEPDDLSEWADMQFLLWDAQRRAGITDEQITQAMIEKLAINKQREWPAPKDGEPRLHIKEQPAPVVPDRSIFEQWWESQNGAPLDGWDSLRTTDGYCDDGIDGQFEAWSAAMLQTQSVCTCPSGDGSLRWPCPSHPGNSPVIPDGSEQCPCCGKKLRRACSVEGCGGKHVAHGLCQKHYDMKRWEDPEQVKKFREAGKRFRDKKSAAAAPQEVK